MSVKSILFVFGGTENELYALNTAFAVAKFHTAQLRILHMTPETTLYMEGIVANPEIMAAIEDDNKLRFKKAKEHSIHCATLHNVPLDAENADLHHASAKFIHQTGAIDDLVAREGRMSDLIIASHSLNDSYTHYDTAIVTSIFNTGRPVMLVPRLQGVMPLEWQNKVTAVAWNGSLEGAHALYNSMPFLERAGKVHILVAREHNKKHLISDEKAVIEYLATHGISSDATMIDHGHHNAAEALLIKAEQLGADLLVMGAYGHSRFREIILGGFTNYMLENSDIPLLLSH